MLSALNASNMILEANQLNYIAMMFIRCYCSVFISFGSIGHLLSIYVFTRPKLWKNSCCRYFLAATVIGLMTTCYILPMRMIQSGFIGTDPGAYSIVFCKITWFFQYSIRGVCPWLIVLASIDRYCRSCQLIHRRSRSNLRLANRAILYTIVFGFLAHIHIPIFFRIDIIPATQRPVCYPLGPSGTYRILLSLFTLFYFGLSPSCCMFLFGILTIKNMNQSKRLLINPFIKTELPTSKKKQKYNRQMLRMLFVQVFVYSVTGVSFSIATIFTSMMANRQKNVFEIAQENLMVAVMGMMANTGSCTSFYLFTLSSKLFRKELKKFFCR